MNGLLEGSPSIGGPSGIYIPMVCTGKPVVGLYFCQVLEAGRVEKQPVGLGPGTVEGERPVGLSPAGGVGSKTGYGTGQATSWLVAGRCPEGLMALGTGAEPASWSGSPLKSGRAGATSDRPDGGKGTQLE